MPDALGRTTEDELSRIVLKILRNKPNRRASFAELIAEIPKRISLTSADHQKSITRPAEEMWEQRVRNLKSHKNSEGNIIFEGLVNEIDGGLELA